MRKRFALLMLTWLTVIVFIMCNDTTAEKSMAPKENHNGFESQVNWGKHIVTVGACQDCHSPKKMTAMRPEVDSSKMLAEHLAGSPKPIVNKKEMQEKGLIVTGDLTTWVGPWGTSYTANLTSDETGFGTWKEERFITALRKGKFKGLASSRDLLPPLRWQMYKNFTDDEIKAIFPYLT